MFFFLFRMMSIRHCLGPEDLNYHMDNTSEEGSLIQGPFKNTLMAHREGQFAFILSDLSRFFVVVGGGLSCPRRFQCSSKCVSWAPWGVVWANRLLHRGTVLGGS